jgi:hypothetical protein
MKIFLNAALVLAISVQFSNCTTPSYSNNSPPALNPANLNNPTSMQTAIKKVTVQVPELDLKIFDTGKSSTSEVFSGEEYASGKFCLAQRVGLDPRELARQGTPYIDLVISIHRYNSSDAAVLDLENSQRLRPAMMPPEEIYNGGTLYKYGPGQNIIFQFGLYNIEITPYSDGARPLVMKVLDAVLVQLDSNSPKS